MLLDNKLQERGVVHIMQPLPALEMHAAAFALSCALHDELGLGKKLQDPYLSQPPDQETHDGRNYTCPTSL